MRPFLDISDKYTQIIKIEKEKEKEKKRHRLTAAVNLPQKREK
jgi:hypothetical protein